MTEKIKAIITDRLPNIMLMIKEPTVISEIDSRMRKDILEGFQNKSLAFSSWADSFLKRVEREKIIIIPIIGEGGDDVHIDEKYFSAFVDRHEDFFGDCYDVMIAQLDKEFQAQKTDAMTSDPIKKKLFEILNDFIEDTEALSESDIDDVKEVLCKIKSDKFIACGGYDDSGKPEVAYLDMNANEEGVDMKKMPGLVRRVRDFLAEMIKLVPDPSEENRSGPAQDDLEQGRASHDPDDSVIATDEERQDPNFNSDKGQRAFHGLPPLKNEEMPKSNEKELEKFFNMGLFRGLIGDLVNEAVDKKMVASESSHSGEVISEHQVVVLEEFLYASLKEIKKHAVEDLDSSECRVIAKKVVENTKDAMEEHEE